MPRAISGPLTPVMSGLSRSLADSPPRRSGHVTGPDGTDSQADSAGSIPVRSRHFIEVVAPQRPAHADRATALPYTRRQPAPSPPGRSRGQDARRTTGCISGPPDATGARKPGKWDPSSSGRSWLLIPDRAELPVARPFCVLDGVDGEPRDSRSLGAGWRRLAWAGPTSSSSRTIP
jgi:hypothetical protein